MANNERSIAARLLALNRQVDARELFPTLVPGAVDLVLADPYAFCLATSLDRGTRSDIIWTIPYWIQQRLGHLDPRRIYRMSLEQLASMVAQLPKRPRYANAAPRTIQEITATVVERFGGDASRIWEQRRAADVVATFQSVYGVGRGIASMAVLLVERGYGIRFSDLDRRGMDIKPDVHTMRVLYRLGVAQAATEREAIAAARRLNPGYPGELDAPLWLIGRRWCDRGAPQCDGCPLGDICPRAQGGG